MASLVSNMPLSWLAISGLAALLLILILVNWRLFRRLKKFEASYVTLQTFMSGEKLEPLLQAYIQRVEEQNQELKSYATRINQIEGKLRASVDRAELIRFRAFENVGSDLSFALALLNQAGNGVVLSAIHSREDSRVYAKSVIEGQSTYILSNEEKEVIAKAMQGEKL